MKRGYFPGCSMHGTSREFGESLLAVAGALDADLREIDDWNCCGASSAHVVNRTLAVALPARNLALAEAQGLDEILAPCAACYNRLAGARHALATDGDLSREMPGILGRPLANRVAVRNILEVLLESAPLIKERLTLHLNGLKVACYYGCLLVRPAHVTGFDDGEQPESMEKIAALCGATPVPWSMALECCGGSFSVCRTGSVVRLGRAIVSDARRAGADAIVVACPMCHSNLDFRQSAMQEADQAPLPVLYVTELVGLALGLAPDTLGLGRHFVSPAPLIASIQAAAADRGNC